MSRAMAAVATAALALATAGCRYGLDNSTVGEGGLVIPPGCGDGVVDVGEACDDGNAENTDRCLENCQLAVCGDGFVRAEVEECDDGNDDQDDGCTTLCRTCGGSVDRRYVSETTGACYTFHALLNDFTPANDQCVAAGGTLAAYSSAEETAELIAALPVTEPTWLGLSLGSGGWQWTNGEPELYTNWADGFPDTNSFGVLNPDGTWSSVANTPRPFLCEIKPAEAWHVRPEDGHAYRRFTTQLSWEVAQAECERRGAHLATITSAAEAAFIRNELGVLGAWIGLTDAETEGEFLWVTGEPTEFVDFADGQPDGGTGANCVMVATRWADAPCSNSDQFICELD